jgi:ATP-dependent Clp protease protease subunit
MEIDEDALEIVMKGLDEFDTSPEKPVRIQISSYGGSVYDMFGIIDRIKASPCEVHTCGYGKIMSAATLILSSGDQRTIGKDAWLMVHQLSDVMTRKKLDEQINDVQHNQALMKQMYARYEEFSGGKTKARDWEKLCKKDRYITAERALELGLVDHVV